MRIGIVLTNPPQKSETFLVSFINVLSEKHEIKLFTTKKAIVLDNLTQYIYLTKSAELKDIFINIVKLFGNLKKFNILKSDNNWKLLIHDIPIWTCRDLDYLHFSFGNLALGREQYSKVLGCKLSASFRGSDINIYPLKHCLSYNYLLECCNKIHCNSQKLQSLILNHNQSVADKVKIIPPGLQLDFYISDEKLMTLIDDRANSEKLHILSVGRLHWVKGFEKTLEALAKVKKSGIKFIFRVIGEGPEIEQLIFLIHFFNIQDEVEFVGAKTPAEIRVELEKASLFIQTSWAEGFSNSTMEAQALGLPVIVTPVSGMDELVIHEKTGYITENHQSEEIVKGIQWFLNLSNQQKIDVAIMASKNIQQNFSLAKLQTNWLEYFN